ncbi:MAG: hypothetical protein AAFO96_03800 [Bacteroidota bacterium]
MIYAKPTSDKVCKTEGCDNLVPKGMHSNYCVSCQRNRLRSKKPINSRRVPVKYNGILPSKHKGLSNKARKKQSQAIKEFNEFAAEVWKRRFQEKGGVFCEITGVRLPDEYHKGMGMMVSHILPKSTHPELYYDPSNVKLVTVEVHQYWEQHPKSKFYERFPDSQEWIKARIEQLKKKK